MFRMFRRHHARQSDHRTVAHELGWRALCAYLLCRLLLVVRIAHAISCGGYVYELRVV